MKHHMKKSNKLLIGAGIFLCLVLLASVISARVSFDRQVRLQEQPLVITR